MKHSLRILFGSILSLSIVATPVLAAGEIGTRPDQLKFREIYKELVEIDTSVATGNCTTLAAAVEKRLKAGGFTDADIYRFTPEGHPREGGLVVTLAGASRTAKAILLLGHIDVVNAPPEGWKHAPFDFVEQDGFFYGRGAADMKALDAIWIDAMLRLKARDARPKRTLKMALTCGEEGAWPVNGARWLSENKRALIDAEFALNEGGGGESDETGRLLNLKVGFAQKFGPNFKIEANNPGGHSSLPRPDNAIFDLSRALVRISELRFPVHLNDVTRAFFTRASIGQDGKVGQAMRAIVANPRDQAADAILSASLVHNAMLRTTCVPTLLQAGHATNALPQRAAANVNCRILPGETVGEVQAALVKAVNNPNISITFVPNDEPVASINPMSPEILGPMEHVAKKHFPGVPVVPTMGTGGNDARYLSAVGIPTNGVPGIALLSDGGGTHGVNERAGIRAVYLGRDYLFDLVQAYLSQ